MRGQIIKFMGKSQSSKLNLQLAPIPENFERDSDISILLAQAGTECLKYSLNGRKFTMYFSNL